MTTQDIDTRSSLDTREHYLTPADPADWALALSKPPSRPDTAPIGKSGFKLWFSEDNVVSISDTSNFASEYPHTAEFPIDIDEAKARFKDALDDAVEEHEPIPSDEVSANAYRAVRMMDENCPQEVSSVAVREGGIAATVRGANRNYVTAECEANGEVLVLFNVRSYVRYDSVEHAEQDGFFKTLLGTLRYK